MNSITKPQLIQLLQDIRGAEMVTITTQTIPDMRKGGKGTAPSNPYWGILDKISKVNGVINFIYGNSVNRQRGREGSTANFQPQPRKWGQHIYRADGTVTPLVEHNGSYYVEIKVEAALSHMYRNTVSGEIVADDDVKPFLAKHSSAASQGVVKEVILRDYAIDSIIGITIGSQDYVVI